jgi:MarR family transcriptional regulator, organic hydroperoxide resistance regulator
MDVTHVTVDSVCRAGESDGLGCHLQHLARLQRALLRRALEDEGLHPGQEQLLTVLWANGPSTQADLAAALEIDTSTVSKTLTRLERAGFVSRCRVEGDKRAVLVSTTAQGDSLRPRIDALIADVDNRLTGDLTQDERATLFRLLRRVAANVHGC